LDRLDRINIRPGVSVLSVLRHLNYKPWFALAEFVDNSIQSYRENEEAIRDVEGPNRLSVEISYEKDDGRLRISDTAAGIRREEYERAFRPAELPPDRSGLSEFGMGMKSAACWFSPRWHVCTSALGESVKRTIRFDIKSIVNDELEELDVAEEQVSEDDHYTHVVLEDLYSPLHARTIGKIKEHLADIYRQFLREDVLLLKYDGTPLTYDDPPILDSPYFEDPVGPEVRWRKEIDFDFGDGLKVRGFAALRDPGSVRRAGFALFRRGRLIQGSGDEGYRPRMIFGNSNSYTYQRLFGELHLKGFEVSHTKDGIRWDDSEVAFLEVLKEHLDREPRPLLKQAEGYRKRRKKGQITSGATEAAESTTRVIRDEVPGVLSNWDDESDNEVREGGETEGEPSEEETVREIEFLHGSDLWRVRVTLGEDPNDKDWLDVKHQIEHEVEKGRPTKYLDIRLALLHPFMDRFAGEAREEIEPLLRVAAGLAISEHLARAADVRGARMIRRGLNRLLKEGLAQP